MKMKTSQTKTTPMMGNRGAQQSGLALITVLLIVALLTALVYHLMVHQSLVVAKFNQVFTYDRALAYALGGETFARQMLYADWESAESRNQDTFLEPWAQTNEPLELDEAGYLELAIFDLGGRFNLNSLSGENSEQNLQRLKRLLNALNIEPEYADKWQDWIDVDATISGFGAEDADYLSSELPYRTANQSVTHVSEFRLMKNMDAETYRAVLPYITVLPSNVFRININTASAVTLQSVTDKMSPSKAQSLVETERNYATENAVFEDFPEFNESQDAVAVSSEFFEVQVRVEINGGRVELTSLVHRDFQTGELTTLNRDYSKRFAGRQLEYDAETDTQN